MKKFLLLCLCLLFISGCGSSDSVDKNKMQVAASFYPMAEFAKAVGGDKVQVTTMVPAGAEPHDWEPAPKDLTKLGRSKVFVYNGIVEPWAEQALTALSERNIMGVQAGEGLYECNGKQDPHIWISPKKALVEVERITDAFCAADEANAEYYRANSKKYCAELSALDKKLEDITASAKRRSFVTAHAAFGHLANDYGLRQLAIAGLSPEAEPTPADLQRLINTVRKEDVKYIFFQTLSNPKTAKLLADETGARVSVLDPLEGLNEEGRKENLTYLKIMERNVENLGKALSE